MRRGVEFESAPAEALHGLLVEDQVAAEGGGDAVGGDVVVGGSDASGREDIRIGGPALVHRGDDGVLVIPQHAGFHQRDSLFGQLGAQELKVGVLGLAGQYFVADDEYARGCGLGVHFCV